MFGFKYAAAEFEQHKLQSCGCCCCFFSKLFIIYHLWRSTAKQYSTVVSLEMFRGKQSVWDD